VNTYDVGDGVVVSTTFTDRLTAAPVDPDDVFLDVRWHSSAEPTTYTYGEDDEVVRDSEGVYHSLISATGPGLWHYGWRSSGDVVSAEQGEFLVRAWRPGVEVAP
jgi:hypothetical protein